MSDIVNELREPFTFFCEVCTTEPPPKCSDLQLRAAAEIESLRSELATQETFVATLQEQKYEWDRLTAELAEAKEAKPAKVVTMCGSSRFVGAMAVCAWLIERDERAVTMGLHLLPDWYCTTPDHLAEAEGVASEMDALHLKKIAMSDEIFVVNVNEYIGESTTREVEYAKSLGIPIRWFTHDKIGDAVLSLAAMQEGKA